MRGLVNRLILRPYWRLTRAMTLGVRAVVTNAGGEVLLVRHSYVAGWHFPGGGVERGESVRTALVRELREEAGVEPRGQARLHAVYANRSFPGDHVALFLVDSFVEVPASHGHEILEARFFARQALPEGTTAGTRQRLAEVFDGAPASDFWSDS